MAEIEAGNARLRIASSRSIPRCKDACTLFINSQLGQTAWNVLESELDYFIDAMIDYKVKLNAYNISKKSLR